MSNLAGGPIYILKSLPLHDLWRRGHSQDLPPLPSWGDRQRRLAKLVALQDTSAHGSERVCEDIFWWRKTPPPPPHQKMQPLVITGRTAATSCKAASVARCRCWSPCNGEEEQEAHYLIEEGLLHLKMPPCPMLAMFLTFQILTCRFNFLLCFLLLKLDCGSHCELGGPHGACNLLITAVDVIKWMGMWVTDLDTSIVLQAGKPFAPIPGNDPIIP